MPVELGLELMAIVGADFANPKGELLDNVIEDVYGVGLCVTLIDLQGTYAGRIVNGCILETADILTAFSVEGKELDVHLDMVARNLLGIALGV